MEKVKNKLILNLSYVTNTSVNNITGFIFPKGDIKELTTSLLKIMKLDSEKKKKVGFMARNKAKELYNIELTSKKFLI